MKQLCLPLLLSLLICSLSIHAQEDTESTPVNKSRSGFGIALKVSTFGPGLELIKSFNAPINLRLGGSYFPQKFDAKLNDVWPVNTHNDVRLGSVYLIADWQFISDMHLTAGVLYNMIWYSVQAHPTTELHMGEAVVSPETLGSVTYAFEPNPICPYLGIGYGNSISRSKVLSMALDLGVVYHGSPKASLEATGMVSPTASEEQRQILEENVKELKFYPMISLQLSFRIL